MERITKKELVILDNLMKAIEKEGILAFYELISNHAVELAKLGEKITKLGRK